MSIQYVTVLILKKEEAKPRFLLVVLGCFRTCQVKWIMLGQLLRELILNSG